MRKTILSLAAVLLVSGSVWAQGMPPMPPVGWAPANSPVDTYGRLRVTGANVQSTKTNANVQLRGMSFAWTSDMSDHISPRTWYDDRVVAWLAVDWRVSLVRAAMGVSDNKNTCGSSGTQACNCPFDVGGSGYGVDPTNNKAAVERVVRAAIWQGIYVIIDWHSHRAHETGCSGYPQGERPRAIEFFREMAETYKDYPNIIYEIYNEPICSNCWSGIRSYAEPVIDAIRAIDPNNIIIVGTPMYSSELDNVTAITGTGRTNLAYALHFYCDQAYSGRIATAANRGLAVFVSEFGLSSHTGDGDCVNSQGSMLSGDNHNPSYMSTHFSDMETRSTSWAAWTVSNRPEVAAVLRAPTAGGGAASVLVEGNWTNNDLTNSGRHLRSRLRGTNPGTNRAFRVNITPVGQGTVTGGGNNVAFGAATTLTAAPAAGQRLEGWFINGRGITLENANPNSLSLGRIYYDRVGEAVFFQQNLINNSTFTVSGNPGWNTTGAVAGLQNTNRELSVTMSASPGSAPSGARVQVNHSITLTQNRRYRLSFDARAASGTRTITPTYRPGNAMVDWVEGSPVTLGAAMPAQPFQFEFNHTAATVTNAVVGFACGGSAVGWVLDNVSLLDIGPADISSVAAAAVAAGPFRAAFDGRTLSLSGGGRVAGVTIYDVTGRVRMSEKVSLTNAGTQISLSRLPAGVYTVRYRVDGKPHGRSERIMLAR